MKKLYEVVNIEIRNGGEYGDEHQKYLGFDFETAKEAKRQADIDFANATKRDQDRTEIQFRVYNIDNSVDENDQDEIIDAMCDACGYDIIEA